MANKKLTVSAIKKQDTQYNKKKTIYIDGYSLDIYEKFRPTKVKLLLEELFEAIQECQKENIKIDMTALLSLYLVKHFTELKVPSDLKEQLVLLDIMIDNGYLEKIIKEFDQNELQRVADMLKNAQENIKSFSEQYTNQEQTDDINA